MSPGFARNLNWVLAANAVAGVANFLAVAWFARSFGPATMGDYAVLVTGIQLVAAFLSAGFDQAVIRMHADQGVAAAAAMATAVQSVLLVVASAVVYVVFFLQVPESATGLVGPGSIVLAAIIISLFANLLAAPIAAELDYRFLAIARAVSTFLGISGALGLAAKGYIHYALVARDAISALALLAACWWRAKPNFGWRATRESILRLLHFSKGMWTLNVAERLALRMDYGAVGLLLGTEALGAYFVVRGLVEGGLGFLLHPIQTVLYGHYCSDERNNPGVARIPARTVGIFVLLCLGLAGAVWFSGELIVTVLLGSAYVEVGRILPAMVIYAGAVIWFEINKVLAMAKQNHGPLVYGRLLQMAGFGLLVVPATASAGILGATWATATGALLLAVFATWLAMGA